MVLENDNYELTVSCDETYSIGSADNRHYDIIFNPLGLKWNDHYRALGIRVNDGTEEYSFVFIASYFIYEDSVSLDDNILTVVNDKCITQIDLKTRTIIKNIEIANNYGVFYAIHRTHKEYILIGELEILGLNDSFEVLWCFGKANVILDYKICYDGIKILDDEKKLYKIDFDGNLLEEYPEDWATPTLKANYFWKAWMSPEEYEIEREYYTKNYTTLFLKGKYKPLWKQAEDEEKDVK
ncbi:MAG: hypothetical protein K6G84_10345 [Lachnospiraceae bacterium]|nr:hypothetical protein [Lachnospiraceae bacterium]